MKISIATSLFILLVASLFGWQGHQRLVIVRETHAKLATTAAGLGFSVNLAHPSNPVRITKRERENKDVDAKAAAAQFIAFAIEMEAIEKKGGSPDDTQQKRSIEMMERMTSLDSSQLKILIAEIRAAKDLKDETREGLITFAIMTLANDHPQAALTLLTESPDFSKGEAMSTHMVSSALAQWAKDDPLAALDWVRKNSAKFPDLLTDSAKSGLISGTATQDPRLALKLIDELGIKKTSNLISQIAYAAKTPEERLTTLNAFREYLASLTDEKARSETVNSVMSSLAQGIAQLDFNSASKWIATANFSPVELENFAENLDYYTQKSSEIGQWIDWVGKTLPPDKADNNIRSIVRSWTRKDYQAAGKWLATAPEGPVKNSAIRSYAETVSQYDPRTAAQWALTLPPGADRKETLWNIYNNWPKDDSAAKEAFKQEHGIE